MSAARYYVATDAAQMTIDALSEDDAARRFAEGSLAPPVAPDVPIYIEKGTWRGSLFRHRVERALEVRHVHRVADGPTGPAQTA